MVSNSIINITKTVDAKKISPRGLLILDAAQDLFYHQGFDETSLAMIISQTGGSRRSIYDEFGNKQGLLMAVVQRQVTRQSQTLTLINRDIDVKEALNQVCFKFVQGMLSPELISLFRLVVQQVVKFPELGEMINQTGLMAGVVPLVDYLSWLNEQKILTIENCHFSAQMLLEVAKGPLHTRSLLLPNKKVGDEEISQQVAQAVDIFLKAHRV
ncbi:TetR/AcrR family transcriptional regulator [Colwellia ponticola]|uniref:TetR/AcrR family transcriptional regulator n=1 Tax=Colwellia ponticola TaxID=2304625 RepID=A0A8H2JN04_9GAMM|nr:TetR/AcrR family transcriptional regulator [Colwellia ponticola]TMM45061.1 TetR/AcrR family transcriptional regulator [Colwellia ponticola]